MLQHAVCRPGQYAPAHPSPGQPTAPHLEPCTPLSSPIRRWKVGLPSSQASSTGGSARRPDPGSGGGGT